MHNRNVKPDWFSGEIQLNIERLTGIDGEENSGETAKGSIALSYPPPVQHCSTISAYSEENQPSETDLAEFYHHFRAPDSFMNN